jgi:hypothetical protein
MSSSQHQIEAPLPSTGDATQSLGHALQTSSGGDAPIPPIDPSSSELSELEDFENEGDPNALPESYSYLYVAGLLSRELLPPEPKKTIKMRISCLHPECTVVVA